MASDVVGTPAAPEAVEAPRRGWLGALDKGLLWSLLELFVLTGFVVAQPLLDVTGKAPDFFIFRRADRLDILLLVGIVTVLPALYLWVFELIMRLAPEPLVFALLFATTSPSAKLLLPSASQASVKPAASTVKRPPIVMVFFDEFPLESLLDSSGHVDANVYPNFAKVAGQSVWYRNATGVSGYTPWAVPA